ncbi:uncharacterized protein UTRI_05526 [Ustilago trichophora]|uniref:Mig1 protein n=1 Tax=Ustilago trichophora TaxID=86804 RepID=A0A5C3EG91_9BASI|nr:uncharacterized protein UTRI_05526 [Ustilago trichophora]
MKFLLLALVYATTFVVGADKIFSWDQLCADHANPPPGTQWACFELEKPIEKYYYGGTGGTWGGRSAYKPDDSRYCVNISNPYDTSIQEVCRGMPLIKPVLKKHTPDNPAEPASIP